MSGALVTCDTADRRNVHKIRSLRGHAPCFAAPRWPCFRDVPSRGAGSSVSPASRSRSARTSPSLPRPWASWCLSDSRGSRRCAPAALLARSSSARRITPDRRVRRRNVRISAPRGASGRLGGRHVRVGRTIVPAPGDAVLRTRPVPAPGRSVPCSSATIWVGRLPRRSRRRSFDSIRRDRRVARREPPGLFARS